MQNAQYCRQSRNIYQVGSFFFNLTLHYLIVSILLSMAGPQPAQAIQRRFVCVDLTSPKAQGESELAARLKQVFWTPPAHLQTVASFEEGVLVEAYSGGPHPFSHPKFRSTLAYLDLLAIKVLPSAIVIDLEATARLFNAVVDRLVRVGLIKPEDSYQIGQVTVDQAGALNFSAYGADLPPQYDRYQPTAESRGAIAAPAILSIESYNLGLQQGWMPVVESAALVTSNEYDEKLDSYVGLHSITLHDVMHAVGLLVEPRMMGLQKRASRFLSSLRGEELREASRRFLAVNEMLVMIDEKAWKNALEVIAEFGCQWTLRDRLRCQESQSVEDLARMALRLFEAIHPHVRRIGGSALSPLFGARPKLNLLDQSVSILSSYSHQISWLNEAYFDLATEGLEQMIRAIQLGTQIRFEDVESYVIQGSSESTRPLEKFLRLQTF